MSHGEVTSSGVSIGDCRVDEEEGSPFRTASENGTQLKGRGRGKRSFPQRVASVGEGCLERPLAAGCLCGGRDPSSPPFSSFFPGHFMI